MTSCTPLLTAVAVPEPPSMGESNTPVSMRGAESVVAIASIDSAKDAPASAHCAPDIDFDFMISAALKSVKSDFN